MKKILSMIVCFGLVVGIGGLVGCGDGKKDKEKDKTVTPDKKDKVEPAKDKVEPAKDKDKKG